MDLQQLRQQIDGIDEQLVQLFCRRMEICGDVARYKKENGLPVLDSGRERSKVNALMQQADEPFEDSVASLYSLIFELSRSYQNKLLGSSSQLPAVIAKAIEDTPQLFPQKAPVACQGVEGAYSQQACEKLFRMPGIMYFRNFEGVFSAVEKGLCQYAVIPLENSTAGSVNMVYDLMMRHDFRIVRSTRIKVDHSLMAKPGTELSDIREIFSHEQAISQCSEFIKGLENVKVTVCENTAVAAQMVANSERTDVAAICSRNCAELYNLQAVREAVQDQQNNYTRFICIAKQTQIFPGADRTSLMMVLPHRPGSLYKVLARFHALGLNLIKLESRPLPDRDFEFMFYFDLEASVYSPQFRQLMGELEDICESFSYLGSYSEVI
ncbi:MAG: prephenate dehydratase [Oscillospiraceae bacterium]|nr:prephenate dehydratase [Oscillospiraceae bacterium]